MSKATLSFTVDSDTATTLIAFEDLLDISSEGSYLLETEYGHILDEVLGVLPFALEHWEEFRLKSPHLLGLYSVLALIQRNRLAVMENAGPIYECIASLIGEQETADD